MASTNIEIGLMKVRMESMEDKLDRMDAKLDMLTERLLDPDSGVTARVNRNTSYRKVMSKALWVIYGITIALVIKLFFSE
mgnify:CR=1 FL=1|jgi:hypothetical protein|tara:strand:+ start:1083 stop:1322 length:240 start_codon:yes stop_codon:yes gene_type:complete